MEAKSGLLSAAISHRISARGIDLCLGLLLLSWAGTSYRMI